jgi:hypoxanthine phosphoribosyltransferase
VEDEMIEQFHCELISWATVNSLSHVLAVKIRKTRYRPDIVVAIARGGYVPARLLCDSLNLTDLSSFRIAHYIEGSQKQQKALLVESLCRDLSGKNVLLVDDVSDTGDTLELARNHLAEHGAETIRIAVLHHKQTSTVEPDYFAHRVIKWRWIIYPWAVTEDVTGFIERMPHRPADAGEAVKLLQQYYGVKIRQSLVEEILAARD